MYRILALLLVLSFVAAPAAPAAAQAPTPPTPPTPQVLLTKGPWYNLPDPFFLCPADDPEVKEVKVLYPWDLYSLRDGFIQVTWDVECDWVRVSDVVPASERWYEFNTILQQAEKNVRELEAKLDVEWSSWKLLDIIKALTQYQAAVARLEKVREQLREETERLLSSVPGQPAPQPPSATPQPAPGQPAPQPSATPSATQHFRGATIAEWGTTEFEVPSGVSLWVSSDPLHITVNGKAFSWPHRVALVIPGPAKVSFGVSNPNTTYVATGIAGRPEEANRDGARHFRFINGQFVESK